MGSELMFVRHLLAARPAELWIQMLAKRYHEFNLADIVPLCVMCHNEVHRRYLPYITSITRDAGRRISWFTEAETTHHIAELRKRCARILASGFRVRKEIINDYNAGRTFSNTRRADI